MAQRGYLIGAAPPDRTKPAPIKKRKQKKPKPLEPSKFDVSIEFQLNTKKFSFAKGAPSGSMGRTRKNEYKLENNQLTVQRISYFSDRFCRESSQFSGHSVTTSDAPISEDESKKIINLFSKFFVARDTEDSPTAIKPPESIECILIVKQYTPNTLKESEYSIQYNESPKQHGILKSLMNYLDKILNQYGE